MQLEPGGDAGGQGNAVMRFLKMETSHEKALLSVTFFFLVKGRGK